MISLLNVAIHLSLLGLASGLFFQSAGTASHNVSVAETCSQTQCEVCLSCVGTDCKGLVTHTMNFREKCDSCKEALNNLCYANMMDATDPSKYFKVVGEGWIAKEDCTNQDVDPNTEEQMAKRSKAAQYFENVCSAHNGGMKKTCVESHCESVCSQNCIDPAEGTLDGISIGCMLKMQACYDSHADCLMRSVCDNKLVCQTWKDKNCPWKEPKKAAALIVSDPPVTEPAQGIAGLLLSRRSRTSGQEVDKAEQHGQSSKRSEDRAIVKAINLDSSTLSKCEG